MKAKEYALKIIAEPENRENLIAALTDVLNVVMDAARHRGKSPESLVAVVREQFSKWKSVVAQVKTGLPDFFIEDRLFTALLGEFHPVLFSLALKSRVFLGYEITSHDISAEKKAAEITYEHNVKSMQAEMRRMGFR